MSSRSAAEQKYPVIYIRAILSLSIVLLALFNYEVIISSPWVSMVFIIAVIVSNFIFIALPAEAYKGVRLHYLIFIVDITFIVIASHIYSRLDIQFILAVFLTVFISAISQSVKFSIIVAIVVNAVYFYIGYVVSGTGLGSLTEKTLLNAPFIFIVTLHSSYLAEKANTVIKLKEALEKEKAILAGEILTKNTELNAVKKFAYDLCESFNEAVLIFDVRGNLRMNNKRSEELLGIRTDTSSSVPFSGLDIMQSIKDLILKLTFSSEPSRDVIISTDNGMKMIVNCSYISDESKQKLGIILTAKEAIDAGA